MKGNHGELHALVVEWLEVNGVNDRAADDMQTNKGHGRIERREVWVAPAGELGAYLQEEFGWPEVRLLGQVRRSRRFLHQSEWQSVKTVLWIAGGNLPTLSPAQIQFHLRSHWVIENGIFYVRDVTYDEDRLHGRAIGPALSALRNGAINLIRRTGFRYIADARRFIPARPDIGLSLLFQIPALEN